MKTIAKTWPSVVFIILPLSIIAVDAAVLTSEWLQSDAERAVRFVKESPSSKEGFSVQQYLYTTVYYHRTLGDKIEIEGWQAEQSPAPQSTVTVRFNYSDADGRHTAVWSVNVRAKNITPQNETSSTLSWH